MTSSDQSYRLGITATAVTETRGISRLAEAEDAELAQLQGVAGVYWASLEIDCRTARHGRFYKNLREVNGNRCSQHSLVIEYLIELAFRVVTRELAELRRRHTATRF